MYCIEESTCDVTLLGLFGAPAVIRRPHGDLAPGELCPSHYAPVWLRRVYVQGCENLTVRQTTDPTDLQIT